MRIRLNRKDDRIEIDFEGAARTLDGAKIVETVALNEEPAVRASIDSDGFVRRLLIHRLNAMLEELRR